MSVITCRDMTCIECSCMHSFDPSAALLSNLPAKTACDEVKIIPDASCFAHQIMYVFWGVVLHTCMPACLHSCLQAGKFVFVCIKLSHEQEFVSRHVDMRLFKTNFKFNERRLVWQRILFLFRLLAVL
jgi:hypothetical protein